MLITIVKKEIMESIFSLRFPLFLLVGVILIPMGFYVNEVNYSKRLSDYNEQVRLQDKALTSSQMWDVLSGSVPLKGFLPPAPLSAFAEGLENSLPRFYTFGRDGFQPGEVPLGERSVLSELGDLDFAFIVQMVLSLIVLMFGADVISGEKELGTLRGILSNSVPRDVVLFGKLIGGYISIWLPFTLAFLAGILLLSFTSFPLGNPDMLSRVLMVFLASSVFMLVYFSIGIMISTSTFRTRTSLVAILVLWAFFQLVIPKASNMIADLVYPVRTEAVVSMQKSLAANTLESEKSSVLGKKYEELFGGGSSPISASAAAQDDWNKYREETDRKYSDDVAAQLNAIDEGYDRERESQARIGTAVSLISPGAVFSNFITDLCGTGECERLEYMEAVRTHQQVLNKELFSVVKQSPITIPGQVTGTSVSVQRPIDLKALPGFSMTEAGFSEIISRNFNGFMTLAFWLIVPFAIAYTRFMRYDVR